MYYYYHYSHYYPNDTIVYVEEIDEENNYIILDFIDSDQHRKFSSLFNTIDSEIGKSSMILVKNYYPRKRIRENTAYAIKKDVLLDFVQFISEYEDSHLIKYQIDLKNSTKELFFRSVSLSDIEKSISIMELRKYNNALSNLNIPLGGNLQVAVRNVGLANWNELILNKNVIIVYDVGAPLFASRAKVREIIGNKIEQYSKSKPILFLSHWDKDHYHSLIEMTDEEIKCFSLFICIDRAITNTSKILLDRFKNLLGLKNVYEIPNITRTSRGGKTPLYLISNIDSQVLLFTSMYHKTKNISGLVLAIRILKSSAIFSGDCFYNQLSEHVLPIINYENNHTLIVPHHGGEAGKYQYHSKSIKKKNAIISAGKSKHHPCKYYTDILRSEFEILRSTKVEQKDIIINI